MAASKLVDWACITILIMTQWLIHFMNPSVNTEMISEQWI